MLSPYSHELHEARLVSARQLGLERYGRKTLAFYLPLPTLNPHLAVPTPSKNRKKYPTKNKQKGISKQKGEWLNDLKVSSYMDMFIAITARFDNILELVYFIFQYT